MEIEDAWLEVRVCTDGEAAIIDGQMLRVPAISEVLEAAAKANSRPGTWDYSRRLYTGEMEAIRGALELRKTAEDAKSISLAINVAYKGSCYALTLFAIKRNQ